MRPHALQPLVLSIVALFVTYGVAIDLKKFCKDGENGKIKCVKGATKFFICNNPTPPQIQDFAPGAPCPGTEVVDIRDALPAFINPGFKNPPNPKPKPTTTTQPPAPPPAPTRDCGGGPQNKFGCVGKDVGPLGGTLMNFDFNCSMVGGPLFYPVEGELLCPSWGNDQYFYCKMHETTPVWDLCQTDLVCRCDEFSTGWGHAYVGKRKKSDKWGNNPSCGHEDLQW